MPSHKPPTGAHTTPTEGGWFIYVGEAVAGVYKTRTRELFIVPRHDEVGRPRSARNLTEAVQQCLTATR